MATKISTKPRRTTAVLGKTQDARAILTACGTFHANELAEERDRNAEAERLIDFCRRNLDANAWLPKAAQTRLFAALVAERTAHTQTREELGAALVASRRALKKERDEHSYTKGRLAEIIRRAQCSNCGGIPCNKLACCPKKERNR